MPRKIEKVPQGRVGATVQQFIDFDDEKKVVCTKDVAGTWTVEAPSLDAVVASDP